MVFLIGLETAPLSMLERAEMAGASEELLDVLTQGGWAQDVVTGFSETDRVLRARFFVEADDIAEATSPDLVFKFLRAVAATIRATLPAERLPIGTTVGSGLMEIEPAPIVAKLEAEISPAA